MSGRRTTVALALAGRLDFVAGGALGMTAGLLTEKIRVARAARKLCYLARFSLDNRCGR